MHALYNTETRKLWLERSDGTTRHIGYAMDKMAAYGYLGMARLVRYGDWLPHYGPVVRCKVSEGRDDLAALREKLSQPIPPVTEWECAGCREYNADSVCWYCGANQ